ncbi:beta-N-acetylglucosaminidase domain-containing protein [Streptacidiphilus fuscans]|uniref:Beta-N-acetylglucosaminidase domain-containing protein n=1 Tax=Streptacidiphilus fuscans TaxID=2789292 RepID=A0A931B7G0_9ACTN|nr:beta-N-acetylglucosaminidase domain-containing protein [Streptacidiphilus fuscans]MBF9070411.1 beta-N-acetylglucosaminidase domain-containing protein [Streptacidiphilus fuscans]
MEDHRPAPANDGIVAALGSSLRRTIAEHTGLQQLFGSAPALTARRTAARTARRLAPETADRLISQFKGTAPLLTLGSRMSAQVGAQVRTRSAALRASAAFTVAAVVSGGLVGTAGPASALAHNAVARTVGVGATTGGGQNGAAGNSGNAGSSGNAGDPGSTGGLSHATSGAPSGGGDVSGPAIYPRPQREHTQGTAVAKPARVALAAAPHADPGAVAVLKAALRLAGVRTVDTVSPNTDPQPGVLTIYVGGGAEGASGGTDRALRTLSTPTSAVPSPSGLPSGGYVLASGSATVGPPGKTAAGGIAVLAGVDADGTFNAVQSFRQILGQGGTLPGLVVQDWPSSVRRGVSEAFYGTPWTTPQTVDMLDFMGRTKQNYFLYAPGDDPYDSTLWRTPYPSSQQAGLRTITQAAAADHITVAYSLSLGGSLCYTSSQDQNALIAKMQQLWSLGVRSFQLDFSQATYSHWHCQADADAYGHGAEAAARAQADLVDVVLRRFITQHPDADALTLLPSEFYQDGSTPYRTALAKELDPSVLVVWTGVGVQPATITASDLTGAQQAFGHPLVTEDNYPVNDSAQDRLYLGAYQGRDPSVASDAAGLLVNAMQQPVASRVPLFTAADFAWNPGGYQPQASWQAAVADLAGSGDPKAESALSALTGNSASSPLGQTESAYLRPLLDAFWSAFEPASPRPNSDDPAATAARARAASQLRSAFTTMAQATDNLAQVDGGQLESEDDAWVTQLAGYGVAGQTAVDMLSAQRAGDNATAWKLRLSLAQQVAELDENGVTIGDGVLDPFLDRALQASDSWAGVDAGQLTAFSTMGAAPNDDPALMVDGDPSTYYLSADPPQTGDSFGVDLGSATPVRSVHILMGGPTGDVAAGDIMQDAVLEYSTDDTTWHTIGSYQGQSEIDATLPSGVVAHYLRLRATQAQNSTVAVREFSVTTPFTTPTTADGPAAAPGYPLANLVDGDLDSPYRAASAPQPGDGIRVTLGQTRPLNRVVVLTDPGTYAPGTVEVHSADKGWTAIGAVARDGYTELDTDPKLKVDRIRIAWTGGANSPAPVVYQVIPWYADTPPASLQLSQQSVDLEAGGGAVPLGSVLQAQGVGGATGTVTAQLPAGAKGLTVSGTGPVALPRGGSAAIPLGLTASASTPPGTYTAHIVFTVGSRQASQDVTVHVYPRTGGPDLALTATASSSADAPDFPASNVNDGDPTTRWSSPAFDNEWVQLQLAQPAVIAKVVLHWQDAYASRYLIQTSMDGQNWTTVATVDNGQGGNETVPFAAVNAQYVRMQGVSRATNSGYSLWGMEVYAVTSPPTPPTQQPGSTASPSPNPSTTPSPSPSDSATPDPTDPSFPDPSTSPTAG